jgi:Flp pilus assembly protein TadG
MPMGDAMSTKPRALVTLAAIDRLVSDRHGGVAIEFAFVIPIAILLTVGAVEVARAVSVQASISQAAKETVRVASVRGSASGAAATEAQLEARCELVCHRQRDHGIKANHSVAVQGF